MKDCLDDRVVNARASSTGGLGF